MSQLPALGNRQTAANTLTNQAAPKSSGNSSGAANALMQRTSQDMVALSKKGLDLSAQGLSDRTDALGNATIDVAQDLLGNMARQMFGDGAAINFDSVDLSASSGYAAQMASYAGPNGRAGMAGFSLAENAHFIGKGTITTADGQSFEFEIEVQYESKISASAQYQSQAAAVGDDGEDAEDGNALPSVDLPKMDFAGSLRDLFSMLGQQLRSSIYDAQAAQDGKADADNAAGSLTLRLLDLVQQPKAEAAASAAAAPDATPEQQARAQSQAKALAQAYGAPDGPLKPSA